MNKIIIHVSEVDISLETGMGRVEFYWKKAFEDAGFIFIHIGPKQVGNVFHRSLFPYKAYKYYKQLKINPAAFIIHEPASAYFVNKRISCFLESHGVERKYWDFQLSKKGRCLFKNSISFKTKLFYPLWRLKGCDRGLRNANKLLLIHSEDKDYVKHKYKRDDKDIFIFRNGVSDRNACEQAPTAFTILFNGSWLQRKGILTLIQSAQTLWNSGYKFEYLLIGVGMQKDKILKDWPIYFHPFLKIEPYFKQENEENLLALSSIVILPSFAEGQPLSLLQAMAAGKCCITTNCCGQKDIIQDGDNGFLFEPGNYNSLAALILKCFNDKELIKLIGNNARATVKERTWENVSKEVVHYVQKEIFLATRTS